MIPQDLRRPAFYGKPSLSDAYAQQEAPARYGRSWHRDVSTSAVAWTLQPGRRQALRPYRTTLPQAADRALRCSLMTNEQGVVIDDGVCTFCH